MSRKTFLITVVVLSLMLSIALYLAYDYTVDSDASQYKMIAENLLEHRVYSKEEIPPYQPTMMREPAYPVFLAVLLWLFGVNYTAIYLSQIVIFVLTVVMVYHLSLKVFGERVAGYTAIFTALCPTLANYPSYLLPETLFTFLLVLVTITILKAVQTNKTSWYISAGVLLAITSLTKSISLLLFIPIVFAGVLYIGDLRLFLKKYSKNFMIFTLIFIMLIIPWLARNYAEFGKISMTHRSGRALWIRGQKLDYDLEDTRKELMFTFSEYLGAKLYPEIEDPSRFLVKEAWECYQKEENLHKQGFNEGYIDHILTGEALARIRKQPFKYLVQNSLELFKMTAFLYVPLLNEHGMIEKFGAAKYGQFLLSLIRGILRLLAYLVLFLALFGFIGEWKRRQQQRQWIFIATLIVYINLMYSCLFGWGRYNVPLIPYYLMFAVAGFSFIKRRLSGKGITYEQ